MAQRPARRRRTDEADLLLIAIKKRGTQLPRFFGMSRQTLLSYQDSSGNWYHSPDIHSRPFQRRTSGRTSGMIS